MTLPLAGIRVIEFCQVLAGPFCGCLLADMGADVVKVEPPEGDAMRSWPPMNGGVSQYFLSLNRNKRSIALDLKAPGDAATARRLAASAQIVLENSRPGVMKRLGLDYETLRQDNPALVYCSISAFGQTGPLAQDGGFDVTLQAMSGLMSVTGERGGSPVKCGVPVADSTAGLYAAFSSIAALLRAQEQGVGEHVDMAMLGGMLSVAHLQTSEFFATGRNPVALGSAHPTNAPYSVFACRDGSFAIAAGTNKLFEKTCAAVARPDLLRDERFATPGLRGINQQELGAILQPEFLRYSLAEIGDRLRGGGVPFAPVNAYSDVLSDSQVEHMGWINEIALDGDRMTRTIAPPQRLSGRNLPIRRPAPMLNEHADEIVAETVTRIMPDNSHRFRRFVAALTQLVNRSKNEAAVIEGGARLLADLVAQDDWLPVDVARSDPEHYRQYLLYCDPLERFSIISSVWGPGQAIPIHDHGTWGLVGVLRGVEMVRRYSRVEPNGPLAEGPERSHPAGHVDILRPSEGDIHSVRNGSPAGDAVSIHVYGKNIAAVARSKFDPATGEASPLTTRYANATIPNFWQPDAADARGS